MFLPPRWGRCYKSFQVNFLGHFLLVELLLPKIRVAEGRVYAATSTSLFGLFWAFYLSLYPSFSLSLFLFFSLSLFPSLTLSLFISFPLFGFLSVGSLLSSYSR